MTKNTALFLLFLFLIGSLIVLTPVIFRRIENPRPRQAKRGRQESKDTPTVSLLPQSNSSTNIYKGEVESQGKRYNVIGFIVEDPEKLYLYTNFGEKLTSTEAMREYGCRALISGGLYTRQSSPIGLFISEGRQLKSMMKDEFYNGVFYLNYNGDADISYHEVTSSAYQQAKNARIAIQSGPTFFIDGSVLPFEDRGADEARRVVVGITETQQIVFMVFYKEDSVFLGPTLSILTSLVLDAGSQMGIKIDDALNLDGGSASALISENLSLSELTPVGSYFCVKLG